MKVSIILPTYNEKNNILLLVKKILKILKNYKKLEILVIDDDSPDGTYEICKKNLNLRICKIFKRKKNRGLARSIDFGIKKSSGDKIIVMDTDFTHDPKYLNKFLLLSNNYEFIIGSRFVSGGKMVNTTHHYLSLIFNFFLTSLLKTGVKDNLGGYFCLKKNLLKYIKNKEVFLGYGEYFFRLIYYLKKKNIKIREVGVIYNLRHKGRSKSNFFKLFFQYSFEAIKLYIKNFRLDFIKKKKY